MPWKNKTEIREVGGEKGCYNVRVDLTEKMIF